MATLVGTVNDDFLQGTLDSDFILAAGGNDTLIGAGGNDTLSGGNGSSTNAGTGGDRDLLQGGEGNDLLFGREGFDTLFGGVGEDTLFGGRDNDAVSGDVGNDWIYGDRGSDVLDGGEGNDTIVGGTGILATNNGDTADIVRGGAGNDSLLGNLGNDTIEGGDGDDTINGGKQNDRIDGGNGNDLIFGDQAATSSITSFNRTDYPACDRPSGLVSADIDGDGDVDLIVPNPGFDAGVAGRFDGNSLSILRNNGNGTFAAPVSFVTGVGALATVADFDGDGDPDIATANAEDDTVSLLRNNNGDFGSLVSFPAGDRPLMRDAADIDGDGDADLITINTVSLDLSTGLNAGNTLAIHRNNGNGSFANPEFLTVGNGATDARAADLDGDGDLDIATANEADNTISVLLNNGNGTFGAQTALSVGVRPFGIVAADLDNDGDIDLANSNFDPDNTSGTISLLRNNGNGTFAPAVTFATNRNPGVIRAGDLDGDSDLDLIMLNSLLTTRSGNRAGNTISILRNNGDGTFVSPETLSAGEIPLGLIIDDLDGTGNLDFATSNYDNDNVSVYLNSAIADGDTLTGGAGADRFFFTDPGSGDVITDFQPGEDQIQVNAANFGLTAGAISADQFAFGSAAADSSDRFIYNVVSGDLLFDPDGNGTAAARVLAMLSNVPALTAANIVAV